MKKQLLCLSLCFTMFSLIGQNLGIQLDGTTESLSVAHKDNQNIGDAFTIEAWIFANAWSNEVWRGSIVNKDNQGPDRGYGFRCGDNGKLSFVMAVDNAWEETLSPSAMNVNQWHHIAVTIIDKTVRLYIDGQQVASSTYDGEPSALPEAMTIGASTGFDGRFFDGVLDEVRIWNIARTQAELADNADVELTGTENGLAYYFPMNDGSGNIATNIVDPACSATGSGIDDSNWVDGYQLPEFDLSLNGISSVDRSAMKTRPVKLSVNLQNVGLNTMSDPALSVSVNGTALYTETASINIEAGQAVEYDLQTPIDLTQLADVEIEVTLSQTQDSNDLNNTAQTSIINTSGNRVTIFQSEQHNFGGAGQNQFTDLILPTDLSIYEQLIMHISVDCPSGGCDPWDQPAKVIASNDQGTYEIARYITPFGISCDNWTIDVTDFRSILGGANLINSYVQVWGANGWLVNIELEMIEGASALPYSKLTNLWSLDYQIYGDPGISHDLAPITHNLSTNSESSHVRMQITGHGQGNTNNAAEFFNVNHDFVVDGNVAETHNLWKNDCNQNPCSNQSGTWLTPRAGWCPGQAVEPRIFAMDALASAGSTVEIDYELQDYTNLLNTGYNSSGHTEPHYRLHGFYVEQSSQRYEDYFNLQADAVDFESGIVTISDVVVKYTNNGSQSIDSYRVQFFMNNELIEFRDINQTLAPGESGEVIFPDMISLPFVENKIYGEVISSSDQNPGDNLVLNTAFAGSNTNNIEFSQSVDIYPNPSSGIINITQKNGGNASWADIYTADGRYLDRIVLNTTGTTLELNNNGIHLIKISDASGNYVIKKIMIAR